MSKLKAAKANKLLTHTWFAYDEEISELQKSIRMNRVEEASYAAMDILRSGFGGHVWNRLITIVDEDVGFINPNTRIEIVRLYEETASHFKSNVTNAWKSKAVRVNILKAIEIMCLGDQGIKTRIASHMSPAMFSI